MSSRPPYQPLSDRVPITNPDGTPTPFMIQLLQERGLTADTKITAAQAVQLIEEWSAARFINTNLPLTGGGSLAADLTLDHAASGAAAGTYGDGLNVPQITVDVDGHVTAAANVPISGGGSGSYSLIETLSPAAVASINSEAWAGGAYKKLLFDIHVTPSNDGVALTARFKLNGAYKTAANHRYSMTQRSSSAATNSETNQVGTSLALGGVGATWGVGNATLEHYVGEMMVIRPFDTAKPKTYIARAAYGAPSGAYVSTEGGGAYDGADAANALEGVQFLVSTGTFTGTIDVYGTS